jgi:hypothetical protein
LSLSALREAGRLLRTETRATEPVSVSFNYTPNGDRKPVRFTIDYRTFLVLLSWTKGRHPIAPTLENDGDVPEHIKSTALIGAARYNRDMKRTILLGWAWTQFMEDVS